MKGIKLWIFLFVLGAILLGCSSSDEDNNSSEGANEHLTIYTTVYPLQYIIEELGGDTVTALSVFPPGADGHIYEPTSKEMTDFAKSDAFIYVGAGMEGFADSVSDALASEDVEMIEIGQYEELFKKGHTHTEPVEQNGEDEIEIDGLSDHYHTGDTVSLTAKLHIDTQSDHWHWFTLAPDEEEWEVVEGQQADTYEDEASVADQQIKAVLYGEDHEVVAESSPVTIVIDDHEHEGHDHEHGDHEHEEHDHEGHDHEHGDHDHEGHDHEHGDHEHEGHDHEHGDHEHEGHDHEHGDHDHEGHDHEHGDHEHEGHDHEHGDHEHEGDHHDYGDEGHEIMIEGLAAHYHTGDTISLTAKPQADVESDHWHWFTLDPDEEEWEVVEGQQADTYEGEATVSGLQIKAVLYDDDHEIISESEPQIITIDDHTDHDPHIWVDPLRMIEIAEILKEKLIELNPDATELYNENFTILKDKLTELDQRFVDLLNQKENKHIIVPHSAFGYWEERYGIEQITISGLSSSDEPSQKDLVEVMEAAEEYDLDYILYEQNSDNRLSRVVQEEIGAEALTIHNLEVRTEEDIENEEDYISLMEYNLEILDQITK